MDVGDWLRGLGLGPYEAAFRESEIEADVLAELTDSWTKPRRVVAKVEWHPGELYPRVGFIVTNTKCPAKNVSPSTISAALANNGSGGQGRDQDGHGCRAGGFAANAVRLQLHALAYNLGNFLRRLATPEPIKDWSLTSLKERVIKIGAKVVSHGRMRRPDGQGCHAAACCSPKTDG